MSDDDLISAYLDGELDAEQAAAVEQRLRADRGAAARLNRLREADDLLRAAMPPVQQVSDQTLAALIMSPQTNAPTVRPRRLIVQAAALAAAMLLGVAFGRFVSTDNANAPSPFAISAVESHLLDTLPSGQAVETDSTMFEVALSLRSDSGALCRQYQLSNARTAVDVLACAEGGGEWRMAAAAPHVQTSQYVPAGASSAIDAAIAALGPSEALDIDQERDLIERGWR